MIFYGLGRQLHIYAEQISARNRRTGGEGQIHICCNSKKENERAEERERAKEEETTRTRKQEIKKERV
jgi:hypothetical protein